MYANEIFQNASTKIWIQFVEANIIIFLQSDFKISPIKSNKVFKRKPILPAFDDCNKT